MTVSDQIKRGKLICPQTRQPLCFSGDLDSLTTPCERHRYPVASGIPILLTDAATAAAYSRASSRMLLEYSPEHLQRRSLLALLTRSRRNDYRTPQSVADRDAILPPHADKLYLAVGGGPRRPLPGLTNLNIGPFPNVDVVGDAQNLPYADNCVDAIYCEAVLEHLAEPARAVAEMHRVLKPGGSAYACTPFMQCYHGYPHHYQNFALTGHSHLFTSQALQFETRERALDRCSPSIGFSRSSIRSICLSGEPYRPGSPGIWQVAC